MQKAELILTMLKDKSNKNPNYKFKRLYRYLFNIDFYLKAYSKKYCVNRNIKKFYKPKVESIHEVIEKLKNETYYPKALRKLCGQNKEYLQITDLYDDLIQRIIGKILLCIYNTNFSGNSHGFMPNRNCHTALYQIKTTCSDAKWVIRFSLEDCFYSIDYNFITKLLNERISDGRLINLVNKFLKAGYMKEKKNCDTWSGILPRNDLANILINIYLDKLDKYINEEFVQLKYVRYLDNFVIFIFQTKNLLVEYIIDRINIFLKEELNIDTSKEKISIFDLNKQRVKFLGYEIAKGTSKYNFDEKDFNGLKLKGYQEKIHLLVPSTVIRQKIKPFILNGKSIHNNCRINLPIFEIIYIYNKEIMDLYNYYCLANDVNVKIRKFKFYHYVSLLKTLARKEQMSVKHIIDKYGIEFRINNKKPFKKIMGIKYNTEEGIKNIVYFNEPLRRKNRPLSNLNDIIWN